MHFPTDINLLWDSARKSIELIEKLIDGTENSGWRKRRYWLRRIKRAFNKANRRMFAGGKAKEEHLLEEVMQYLNIAERLSKKIKASEEQLKEIAEDIDHKGKVYKELGYFEEMLDKHIDLVRRRIIFKEKIPHKEKLFSLFEPFTRWVNKGKGGNRIELGLPIAVSSDQYGFFLHNQVMEKEVDAEIAVPVAEEIIKKWPKLDSLSFDKGFYSKENYLALKEKVSTLVMPKRGKLNKEELHRETSKEFIRLRRRHSAIESDINALEHHGLNRCPDKGIDHFKRYVSLGILSLNLHRLGNILLEQDRKHLIARKKLKAA
ncbi:MAG: transposase [Thermodesulfobacteriota bacterium]